MLPKTRSNFAETQNLQICIVKGIGVISERGLTDSFITIKSKKNLDSIVYDCTNSVANFSSKC